MNKQVETISMNKLLKHAKLIALKSATQVKKSNKPKAHKEPSISWDKNPEDYKGVDDENYPTAIVCDYIPELEAWFTVIDSDKVKNSGDIPLTELNKKLSQFGNSTYINKTPSGGLHLYLLSKEKPTAKEPKFNLDYQANTGTGRGKYIVYNYRWNVKGNRKQVYEKYKLGYNNDIAIVKNSDLVLNQILEELNKEGLIKTEIQRTLEDVSNIFSKYYTEGNRQKYSCAIVGYLRKMGVSQENSETIIETVFSEDEELETRVLNVKLTYEKDMKDVIGYKYLKDIISKEDQDKLNELLSTDTAILKNKIVVGLIANKEPTAKLLFDYINQHLHLYQNLETRMVYEKLEDGSFKAIDEIRLVEFCNQEFGTNMISTKRCYECLKFVTNPVKKNYNYVEFKNGILDTRTLELKPKTEVENIIPKMSIPFNWNSKAEGGYIREVVTRILHSEKYPKDLELWLRAVGHAFLGTNRIGKIVMVVGSSGTGKSTLTELLKRIFNYSLISTASIVANKQFSLYGLIDKDINIDDDIDNGVLKGIGTLNSVVTGNGLEVEVKHEKYTIKAENQQLPRLFANGNTLPPVQGEGFDRRLLLLHANNEIAPEEQDEMLQMDISNGIYDKEIEWLIYTSLLHYHELKNEPIVTTEMKKEMRNDYEFQSYPLKKAIEMLFEDDIEDEGFLPVKEVNQILKEWSIWAYKSKLISKEKRKPSVRSMDTAMNAAGYTKARKRFKKWDKDIEGYIENQATVFQDIKIRQGALKLIRGEV